MIHGEEDALRWERFKVSRVFGGGLVHNEKAVPQRGRSTVSRVLRGGAGPR